MIKTGFRRFDIWLCSMEGDVIPHYCVIISNYKNNIKSSSVNLVMISSQLKKLPSHVDIIGFGLTKPSQIKCEKLITKEKKLLIRKVGNINDLGLQIKIEEAIQNQLQIDVEYNSFNALDLENLFVSNNNTVKNDKVRLEKLKSELFVCYKNERYEDSIILAKNLIDVATELKFSDKNFLWYGYYMISRCSLNLNNVAESLENAEKCLTFISKPSSYSHNYGISLWLVGNIREEMKDNDRCLKIYSTLVKYYKNADETIMRIANLYSIAYVKRNRKAIINIYNILEKVIPTNRSIYNSEDYKRSLLQEITEGLNTF